MNSEEYEKESNSDIFKKIEDFSDSQINNEIKEDIINQKDTIFNINLDNVNQNDKNNGKKFEKNNSKEDLSNITTTFKTKLTKIINSEKNDFIRKDNLRKEAFYVPMIHLKKFFKERFNLNFNSFKCDEVFGVSLPNMKKALGLEIYQILCYYPENIMKIINAMEKIEIMEQKEKMIFFYFMTRTYEEIYNRYIIGDNSFPLIKGGTVKINKFITLKKIIKRKEKKLKNGKKTENFIRNKMQNFENISKNMINDIKNNKLEREKRKEKEFITVIIEKFEIIRSYFKADELSVEINLEE